MKTIAATVMAAALAVGSAVAACIDRVDVSKVSGQGSAGFAKTICDVPAMAALLESATVSDSLVDSSGRDIFAENAEAIESGDLTWEKLRAQSAKIVKVEFRAGSILVFSYPKLREKIEQYMTETYLALFRQSVPVRQVKISALYPMSDGTQAVVYGTTIRNEGHYGPGNLPRRWETWRLHRDLR